MKEVRAIPAKQVAGDRNRPLAIDLFAGAGGLSKGFQMAGFDIGCGVDLDADSMESYQKNLGAPGLVRDVMTVSGQDILAATGGRRPQVVLGGPSCQGFSTSGGLSKGGGRDLYDPRNSLYREYVRLVSDLQPDWVVLENVPGLLLYHHGQVAMELLAMLAEIGYQAVPRILLAADFGVPQLRRRLIVIACRGGSEIPFPIPDFGDPTRWTNFALPFAHLSSVCESGKPKQPHRTLSEAIGDLPPLRMGEQPTDARYATRAKGAFQRWARKGGRGLAQHWAFKVGDSDMAAIRHLQPGENWRALPPEILPARFKRIRPYDATTVLRRLRWDEPSYTITTKFNEATTGSFIHPLDDRTLSIREAARLQSFPDSFTFSGSPHSIRRQIGNAVPPLLAQEIATTLLRFIEGSVEGAALFQPETDPLRIHGRRRDVKVHDPLPYDEVAI